MPHHGAEPRGKGDGKRRMFRDMMPMVYGNDGSAGRTLRAFVGAILLLVLANLLGCSPGEDSATRLERAQTLEAAGDVRAAAFELRRILQDDPDHAQARFGLGRLNVLAARGDAAQRELRRALELGIPGDEVMPWLIDALLIQERFADALSEVSSLLSADNASTARWLLRRVEANLGLGRYDELSTDLDAIADYGVEQARVWMAQAQFANHQGDSAAALNLARKAARADPDDPRTAFTHGWLALRQALFQEAESALLESTRAARARANDSDLTRANLLLVEARLGQGKTSEAEAVIVELESLLGDIPELSYLKGLVAYRQGNFGVARDSLRDTLQRRPEHHQARLLAGGTAFALNEYEEASRQLRRYLAVVPSNDAARRLLAAAQARLGRHGDAMAVLEPLRAGGQDAESVALLAMIGRSATVSGEFETAESAFREALAASPGDPALRGDLARLHAAQGRYDEAIDQLSALVREGDAAAELFLVRTLVASGNVALALSQARALAERSPDRPEWHTLVGLIQLQQGERTQGRASLINALNVDDAYLPALLALGRLGLEEGNQASAERYFNAVLRIEPRHGLAMLGLAESAVRRGDVSTAESWLQRAVEANPDAVLPRLWLSRFHAQSGNADAAISTAREAVAASPRDPRALGLLAELQARNGDLDGAADTYGMLINVVPDDLTGRLALAGIAAQQGREGEARQHINAALEVAPRDLRVLEQAGRVELILGQVDASLAYARQARESYPSSPVGWMLEADALVSAGRHEQARDAYARAHRVLPASLSARRLAQMAERAGDERQALEVLQDWLETSPQDVSAMLNLAMLHQRHGRRNEAEVLYGQVLTFDPDQVAALNNLAWLYHERQDSRALEMARKAYELQPGAATSHTYGWMLVESGDVASGLSLIESAAEAAPIPEVRYRLAVALTRAGDDPRARQVLGQLLGEHAQFQQRTEAEALYRSLQ